VTSNAAAAEADAAPAADAVRWKSASKHQSAKS